MILIKSSLNRNSFKYFRWRLHNDDGNPTSVSIASQCLICTLQDVLHRIEAVRGWTTIEKLMAILGIEFAMDYLHSQRIVDGFVKLANVLLNTSLEPLVSDVDPGIVTASAGGFQWTCWQI
jgi:hypothetical protein